MNTYRHLENREQAIRSKSLFWSVIDLAVDDACRPPLVSGRPVAKAITAMRFLTTNIDDYLIWLDVDPPVFRRRLLEAMYTDRTNKFSDLSKRAFRFNYNWWMTRKDKLTDLDWIEIYDQEERDA